MLFRWELRSVSISHSDQQEEPPRRCLKAFKARRLVPARIYELARKQLSDLEMRQVVAWWQTVGGQLARR